MSPRSGRGRRRGSGQHLCEAAEVLRGGGEVNFVTYAAGSAQTESSQAEDALEVGEQDFDFLPQPSRLGIGLGRRDGAGHVAGALVDRAADLALRRVRAASRLEGADGAVAASGAVFGRLRKPLALGALA